MKQSLNSLMVGLCILGMTLLAPHTGVSAKKPAKAKAPSFYSFTVKNIDGKDVKLSSFKGKVLLIVNTASQCGYTPQYAGLQKLYAAHKAKGLVVLGFPANNFGQQEPGSDKQIKAFCSSKFHVTFPMFSKISVTGKDIHPLYRFLTSKTGGSSVSWNFNKFLVSKTGAVIGRFESSDTPLGKKIVAAIKKQL